MPLGNRNHLAVLVEPPGEAIDLICGGDHGIGIGWRLGAGFEGNADFSEPVAGRCQRAAGRGQLGERLAQFKGVAGQLDDFGLGAAKAAGAAGGGRQVSRGGAPAGELPFSRAWSSSSRAKTAGCRRLTNAAARRASPAAGGSLMVSWVRSGIGLSWFGISIPANGQVHPRGGKR